MLTRNEYIIVKKGIENGYDLEILSAEFNVSVKDLMAIKKQLDAEKFKIQESQKRHTEFVSQKTQLTKSFDNRMSKIRERYNKIFYSSSESSSRKIIPENSEEDNKIIQKVIEEVKKEIENAKTCKVSELPYKIKNIYLELKKIQSLNLSVDQGKELSDLLVQEEVKLKVVAVKETYIRYGFNQSKKMIFSKFVAAVANEAHNTDDLEKLKKLNKLISSELERDDTLAFSPVKRILYDKINKIVRENAINNINLNISPDMSKLISDLCSGTVKLSDAKEVIAKEAEKIKTNQFIKENQKEEQIGIRIRNIIKQSSLQCEIVNGEKTVQLLQEVTKCTSEVALDCVVSNYIKLKKYDDALAVCDKFSPKEGKSNFIELKSLDRIKRKVIVAQIGDIILKGIKTQGTPEEENAYIQMIENNLRRTSINLSSIDLGKSQDGKRRITLADIWEERTR